MIKRLAVFIGVLSPLHAFAASTSPFVPPNGLAANTVIHAPNTEFDNQTLQSVMAVLSNNDYTVNLTTKSILASPDLANPIVEMVGPTAPDNDMFSGMEATLFGGHAISSLPFTYATGNARNTSGSLKISAEPYGAYDAGAGLSLFTEGGNVTQLRAGVSGIDWRAGPSTQTGVGSYDMVGFYEDIANTNARVIVPNVTYDATHVYMPGCGPNSSGTCAPLSTGDMSRIYQGMYIVTNSIDVSNPSPIDANTGNMIGPHYYGAFVNTVDPSGKFITVNSWAEIGGGDSSPNQVPSTVYDTYFSTRNVPTIFIGAPTKSFGRNLFIHYNEGDSSNQNTSMTHALAGEEMDFRGNISKSQSVSASGIVISGYLSDNTPNKDGLTKDSTGVFVGGSFPTIYGADPGAKSDVLNAGSAYLGHPNSDWDIADPDTATLGGYSFLSESDLTGNNVLHGMASTLWHVRSTKSSAAGTKSGNTVYDDDLYSGGLIRPAYRDAKGYEIGRKDTVWGMWGQVAYHSNPDWAVGLCGTTPSAANTSNYTTDNTTCGIRVKADGSSQLDNAAITSADITNANADSALIRNALALSAASIPSDTDTPSTFTFNGQGTVMMWNWFAKGRGETEFYNVNPSAVGGMRFFDVPTGSPVTAPNELFRINVSDGMVVSRAVHAPSYSETLSTPSSSSAPCVAGQFTDDANYHYVCVATNTWKRAALSSF